MRTAPATTPRKRPIRAPIQAVELGELLSCIPGLAHDAAARESEAITAPKTTLISAAPMITPLELTWMTGMKDSSPVTVEVAAHQLLATTKPISPSPAPVQAPTLTAVRTRRRSDTGSRTTSGSGSTSTADRYRRYLGLSSRFRLGLCNRGGGGLSRFVRLGRWLLGRRAAGAGADPAAGAPPAHAFNTSSTDVPLAVALAAADRCTSVSGTFKASAAAVSSSLTGRDSNWIHPRRPPPHPRLAPPTRPSRLPAPPRR